MWQVVKSVYKKNMLHVSTLLQPSHEVEYETALRVLCPALSSEALFIVDVTLQWIVKLRSCELHLAGPDRVPLRFVVHT